MELIRQLLTQRTILDRERQRFVAVNDINILAAATSPGLPGECGGHNSFTNLYHVIIYFHYSFALSIYFCISRIVLCFLVV